VKKKNKKCPSKKIAGKGKITGDIMSPVIEAKDWDALN